MAAHASLLPWKTDGGEGLLTEPESNRGVLSPASLLLAILNPLNGFKLNLPLISKSANKTEKIN